MRGINIRETLSRVGPADYNKHIFNAFGLSGSVKDRKYDKSKAAINPHEVNLQEVAYDTMGHYYMDEFDKLPGLSMYEAMDVQEAGGASVLPSAFANISAFKSTVTGLLEALIMDAYESPQFIGDQMVTVVPTNVSGGKMIGVKITGQEDQQTSIEQGIAYPTVKLAEDWVNIPENERNGLAIEINKNTIRYDRTAEVSAMAEATGYRIAKNREIKIARMVMGIDNTYQRQDTAANTYNSIAADSPNDYVNQAAIGDATVGILNHNQIDQAIQILESNVDPVSGDEITVAPENATILVAPNRKMQALSVVRATMVEQGTRDNQTFVTQFPSPLPANFPVVSSRIWYNQAVAAGYSDSTWWMGQFGRAFAYRELIPFFTAASVIGFDQDRRDVALAFVSQEHGVPFTKEPRYAGQFSPEGTG